MRIPREWFKNAIPNKEPDLIIICEGDVSLKREDVFLKRMMFSFRLENVSLKIGRFFVGFFLPKGVFFRKGVSTKECFLLQVFQKVFCTSVQSYSCFTCTVCVPSVLVLVVLQAVAPQHM